MALVKLLAAGAKWHPVAIRGIRLISDGVETVRERMPPEGGDGSGANLGFFVRRSKFNNLPVYTEYRHGRSIKITVVRKIEGNLGKLADLVQERLPEKARVRINETTSSVVIEGPKVYWKQVSSLLAELGF